MCGICGFITKKKVSIELLNQMNDTMQHRGPDDHGAEILSTKEDFHIGLAQRRLAIIDLSPLGRQPMFSADKSICVVFNGEIYNFRELRAMLVDYPYQSNSDTEVIIAAYLHWGEEFVNYIHGMFAIALWDQAANTLYMFRDRIGKKPLYYWFQEDEIFFGSELKSIMTCPWFPRKINRSVLPRYLFQKYINAPESIFENVYKVEPGTYICIALSEHIRAEIHRYWDIPSSYHTHAKDRIADYATAKQGLKEKLTKAIEKRLVADVPVGCLLSGGIDSSLVAAIAQSVSKEPIQTFTIGFDDPQYNEAQFAKEIAAYLGTRHHELYIDETELINQVESIPRYFDEPFADSSQIPTMLVAKLVKQNATVCLSGDGGDELFCGYNVYDMVRKAQRLDWPGRLAYSLGKIPFGGKKISACYPSPVRKIAGNRDRDTQSQLNPDILLEVARKMVMVPDGESILSCQYPFESKYHVSDWVLRRMLLNMETSLPEDILCKVDRASMKYSVEARNPILDTDVIEYSFQIPQKFKMYGREKKYILKDLTYEYIPRELLDRPKKGFGVPLDKWLKGPLKEQLCSYIEHDLLIKQGLFSADYVEKLVMGYLNNNLDTSMADKNIVRIIWAFYSFQAWYFSYIDG